LLPDVCESFWLVCSKAQKMHLDNAQGVMTCVRKIVTIENANQLSKYIVKFQYKEREEKVNS